MPAGSCERNNTRGFRSVIACSKAGFAQALSRQHTRDIDRAGYVQACEDSNDIVPAFVAKHCCTPIRLPSADNSTEPEAAFGELTTKSMGNFSPVKATGGAKVDSIRSSG